jgi:hypothetical protein
LANHLSPVKAVLVLAGFLVAVGVLVAVGTRPSVSGDSLSAVTTTTVPSHGGTSTTTSTTTPHGSVTVVVANATNTSGLAAHYSVTLAAQGWNMQTPTDTNAGHLPTSTVYYASGQQAAAGAIAATLNLKPTAVQPLTTSVPVSGVTSDDVVVVIGGDLVAAANT